MLDKLVQQRTRTGILLQSVWDISLNDYIDTCFPKNIKLKSPENNVSKIILCAELASLVKRTLTDQAAKRAIEEFINYPMLQLADGSSLLYDRETFLTNFLFQLVGKKNNLSFLFTQQCSRSKMSMMPKANVGSGFLELDSDVYNIFGLSQRKLSKSSVATLKGAVKLEFNALGVKQPNYSHPALPDILQDVKGNIYESAADAIIDVNSHIWRNLNLKSRKELLQFDERLSCHVLARHIEEAGPLYNILFEEDLRTQFLEVKAGVISKQNIPVLRDTCDFFYYADGSSIKPARIRLKDGSACLCDSYDEDKIIMPFRPDEISMALREHQIFPDLVTSYGILSILPGVLAFGGASQHEYLPEIHSIYSTISKNSRHIPTIPEIIAEDPSSGSRLLCGLIDINQSLEKMIGNISKSTDLISFEDELSDKSICELVGSQKYFNYFNIFFDRKSEQMSVAP